jgi:hypothetical protein
VLLIERSGALKDLTIQQSQTSHQLAQSTRIILDTFLNTREELANQLRLQAEKLIEIQECQEAKEVQRTQKIENILKGELGPIGMLQTPKDLQNLGTQEAEKSARALQVEEEIHLLMIENCILQSLAFSTLIDRCESVEIAYPQTFEWVYQEPHLSEKPWSNFVDWLRHGSGIYWISGKAGSGKSTLMRYIYENKKTKEELLEWAGSMPSETFGFFFWNSGDLEQRSQRGLLQSLLFDILQRHRDLLPKILPDVWEAWSARASSIISSKLPSNSPLLPPEPKPWTLVQLKRIFQTLVQTLQNSVKLCLFIDGLDEYEGDYEDIVELLQNYATAPNIKLCLSSRPLVIFERGFIDLPSLKLQNLTYGDISHYVKDKLGSHRYMVQLSQHYAAQVSLLIDEIVEKASGVFLWVKLVVKSLLHGLRDYNRISDLQKRVRHLPADLEALYAHMLEHTDPFYHEQASQIFQIVRAAQKRSSDKVTLLNLSWAEDEGETLAENAPIQPLTNEEISMRCQTMDARLKSVCVGLLESNDVQFSDIAPDSKVLFLHRTVSDFFAKPDVWDRLLSYTAGKSFSPNLSMLRSCVLQLKGLEVSPNRPLDMSIISNALYYAKEAEVDLDSAFPKLLDQLDIAASYQWRMRNANGIYEVDKRGAICMSSSVESLASTYSPSKISKSESRGSINIGCPTFGIEDISSHSVIDSDASDIEGMDTSAVITEIEAGMPGEAEYLERQRHGAYGQYMYEEPEFADTRIKHSGKKSIFGSKDTASLDEPEAGTIRVGFREWSETTRPFGRDASGIYAELRATRVQDSQIVPEGGILHHWSYGIEVPGIKPLGKASTFYDIARDIGLSHYVAIKYKSGIIVDQDVNQHLLIHATSSTPGKSKTNGTAPNTALVDTLLQGGADPNFSYCGVTPWQDAMAAAVSHFMLLDNQSISSDYPIDAEWEQTAKAWVQVFEVFIKHGADPNALSERHQKLPGHPRLSPLAIVDQYFHEFLSQKAAKLKVMLEERGARHLPMVKDIEPTSTNVAKTQASSPSTMPWVFSWFRLPYWHAR